MAPLVVVHSEPMLEQFRAPFCSTANFWRYLSALSIISLSILLSFASQGLWRRTNTFLEKPFVHFTENLFFIFELSSNSAEQPKAFFWSPTIVQLNDQLALDNFELLVPVIETVHSDLDGDRRADEIEIRILFRHASSNLSTTFTPLNVISCSYTLFFDVKLENRALVEIKGTPIFGSIQSQKPFNEINIIGTMDFLQQNLMPFYGNINFVQWTSKYSAVNFSTVEFSSNSSPESLDWAIRSWAMDQNFSIGLGSRKIERVQQSPLQQKFGEDVLFHFTFRVRICEHIFHYSRRFCPIHRTGGWEMLKWAWVQYLALFVIVRFLISALSSFLYQNQIIATFLGGQKNKMH